MCITRLGRILSMSNGRATVETVDTNSVKDVDISMLKGARENSYIEIFGDVALALLSTRQAKSRQKLAMEIRKRAFNL